MQKWEYVTQFLWADATAEKNQDYLKRRWPRWDPPEHAPEAMMRILDDLGEKGWELVHMQPVHGVARNDDVTFSGSQGGTNNAYFCVFKRPKEKSD